MTRQIETTEYEKIHTRWSEPPMVRATLLPFAVLSTIICLATITFFIASGRSETRIQWLTAKDAVEHSKSPEDNTLLICVYAEWDTATYTHFSVIDRNLSLLRQDHGVTPCRVRLDQPDDKKEFRELKRILKLPPHDTTGFLLLNCQTMTHEWYDTVRSDLELQQILRNSNLLNGRPLE